MKTVIAFSILVSSFALAQQASQQIKILPASEVLSQPAKVKDNGKKGEPIQHFDCGNIHFPSGNLNGNSDEGNVEGFQPRDTKDYVVISTGGGRDKCLIPRSLVAEKGYTAQSLHKKLQCQNPNSCYWGNYAPDNYVTLECIGDWQAGPNYSGTAVATDFQIHTDPSGFPDNQRQACPASNEKFCYVVGDDNHKDMVDKYVNDYCDQSKGVDITPADSPQATDCAYNRDRDNFTDHHNGFCSFTRNDHQVCCHRK